MKRSAVAISFLLAFTWSSPTQTDAAEPPQNRIEVVLLGTGYPRPYPDRAGPSTAVVINGRYFIVDAGRAVVLRLSALRLQGRSPDDYRFRCRSSSGRT